MDKRVLIGKWIESESRNINQCPSYYAADYEVLKTTPGEYDLYLLYKGGYLVPMPYYLLCSVDANRIDGATYSGMGGLNFACHKLPLEPKPFHIQMYSYELSKLIDSGRVKLNHGYEWLISSDKPWEHPSAPKTWQEVK